MAGRGGLTSSCLLKTVLHGMKKLPGCGIWSALSNGDRGYIGAGCISRITTAGQAAAQEALIAAMHGPVLRSMRACTRFR